MWVQQLFSDKRFPFRHFSRTPPWVIPVHVASNFTPNHRDIHFHQNADWSNIQFESNGLRTMLCLCHLTTVPNNWAFFMVLPLDSNIIIPVFHWRTVYKKAVNWFFFEGGKIQEKSQRFLDQVFYWQYYWLFWSIFLVTNFTQGTKP